MKNLLTILVLTYLLGTTIHSGVNARVLPIIEGDELLDSLASQNNDQINLPELVTGIFDSIYIEHPVNSFDKYHSPGMNYKRELLSSESSINIQHAFLSILRQNIDLKLTSKFQSPYTLVNIGPF